MFLTEYGSERLWISHVFYAITFSAACILQLSLQYIGLFFLEGLGEVKEN